MNGIFFVNWQLWEEMTFVLACAIILVFLVGLLRLWWTNRRVRRQELIDEEKRARLTQMRKTGLSPTKKRNDIPFGVRALQSGIEVDGIWISRPTTPSRNSSKSKLGVSAVTVVETETNGRHKKDKKHLSEDSQSSSASALARPAPHRSPSSLSMLDAAAANDMLETQSTLSMPLPQISEDFALPSSYRGTSTLSEEALRRLEGQSSSSRAPQLATYIPSSRLSSPNTSISRNHYRPSKRSSTASSESMSSNASSRHASSLSSQKSSSGLGGVDGKPGYAGLAQAPPEGGPRALGENNMRFDPARLSTATNASSALLLLGSSCQPHVSVPAPTLGPGESYANRMARKVNEGFEVLPAGTFGAPHDLSRNSGNSSADDEAEQQDDRRLGPNFARCRSSRR